MVWEQVSTWPLRKDIVTATPSGENKVLFQLSDGEILEVADGDPYRVTSIPGLLPRSGGYEEKVKLQSIGEGKFTSAVSISRDGIDRYAWRIATFEDGQWKRPHIYHHKLNHFGKLNDKQTFAVFEHDGLTECTLAIFD
jgi:hypothetical protein